MMKIIEKKILWKRLTWKIMEKQYSEWAVWARESLTTRKETKQTQPKRDLKDTKIWASFQSFYNRFHWELWVQNSSSIFTMIVCHISWHSPSLNIFLFSFSVLLLLCGPNIFPSPNIFLLFLHRFSSPPQNKYFLSFPSPSWTKYLFLLQIFCS